MCVQTEINKDTLEPTDDLTPPTVEWCSGVGSTATKLSEIISTQDKAVLQAIESGIKIVNERATSHAQWIQKWTLLPRDFSIPGGEFGSFWNYFSLSSLC